MLASTMSQTRELREVIESGRIPAERIDRVNGVIRGVKFLGERSANPPPFNHLYPKSTRAKAIPLLEGKKINGDHPSRDKATDARSIWDGIGLGYACNIKEGGDGLYGDWHFNPKHPRAEDICWEAEHNPSGLSFSINGGSDHKRRTDDGVVVESIDSLQSIDLVSRGATTNGLFEDLIVTTKRKVSVLIEALKLTRPGYSRGLREEAAAGVLSPDTMMDEPPAEAAPSEPADHEAALKTGFKGAMVAVLDDESMDMGAKLKKLKEIMTAQEKLLSGGKKEEPAKEEPAAEEARRRAAGNLRESALLALGRKGVKLTPTIELAIKGCTTEVEINGLVESLATGGGTGPAWGAKSSGWNPPKTDAQGRPLTESKIPEKAADWGKSLIE
jgi:hypothetical protein